MLFSKNPDLHLPKLWPAYFSKSKGCKIWGLDGNYNTELPGLTKLVDKLPFFETKAPSQITITGEYAQLNPGHPKIIGKGGTTYIDDFEGTRSFIDLNMPVINWKLSSTPRGGGSVNLFPESALFDSLDYGKNRAKISWYSVDNVLTRTTNNINIPEHLKNDEAQRNNFSSRYLRLMQEFNLLFTSVIIMLINEVQIVTKVRIEKYMVLDFSNIFKKIIKEILKIKKF